MKNKLAAGTVVALAVGGGGAAIGATHAWSPATENQAVVDDAAKQLGVQPSALNAALKKALENRVDAAVAAGRLTKDQGDAVKARIEAGSLPFFGGGPRRGGGFGHDGGPGRFGHLDAAATYLDLTPAQLQTELAGGKTLADVAKAHGKSVDGLVQALVASEQKELDAAVAGGRLTKEQEQSLLADAKQRFTDLVNGVRPSHDGDGAPPRLFFRGGPSLTTPPPSDAAA